MVLIVLNHTIYLGTIFPQEWGYPSAVGWGRTILAILQSFGWFAVPTFLFISGSFVSYAAQGDPPRLSFKFVYSSLRHILIPYIVWSLVFYILVYLEFNEAYSSLGYVKNLLVGYPYHFVPLLVFFYIFSPLLVRIGRSYGMILVVLIGLYQFLLINILYPETLGFTVPAWAHFLAPPIIRTTLADWGIFFPFGLVYGLHARQYIPWSKRLFWIILAATVGLFILGVLDSLSVIRLPLARYLSTVAFSLLIPAIRRDSIPFVRQLERIGRRSYGIYLTHLLVLNLILLGIKLFAPSAFIIYVVLFSLLFIFALLVPLLVMEGVAKGPAKPIYRYVFG